MGGFRGLNMNYGWMCKYPCHRVLLWPGDDGLWWASSFINNGLSQHRQPYSLSALPDWGRVHWGGMSEQARGVAGGECGGQMGAKRKANGWGGWGKGRERGVGAGFLLVQAPGCRVCTQSLPWRFLERGGRMKRCHWWLTDLSPWTSPLLSGTAHHCPVCLDSPKPSCPGMERLALVHAADYHSPLHNCHLSRYRQESGFTQDMQHLVQVWLFLTSYPFLIL